MLTVLVISTSTNNHITSSDQSALALAAATFTMQIQALRRSIIRSPPFDSIKVDLASQKLADQSNMATCVDLQHSAIPAM